MNLNKTINRTMSRRGVIPILLCTIAATLIMVAIPGCNSTKMITPKMLSIVSDSASNARVMAEKASDEDLPDWAIKWIQADSRQWTALDNLMVGQDSTTGQ